MTLYHGSNEIIFKIDFSKSNLRTDFGKGFYMGSKLGEARNWAIGKAGFSGTPTIMRYTVDNRVLRDVDVNPKRFDQPNIEWLEFVKDNRRKYSVDGNQKEPRHSYGAVSGPIADDMANIVVARYCNGEIDVTEAIRLIRTIPSVFQLSLHTPLALSYIKSSEYQQQMKNGKWSAWKNLSLNEGDGDYTSERDTLLQGITFEDIVKNARDFDSQKTQS